MHPYSLQEHTGGNWAAKPHYCYESFWPGLGENKSLTQCKTLIQLLELR